MKAVVAITFLASSAATNIATRQWLNNTIGAVYLDGSVPAYYVKREAYATKWIVWQKGGGWCYSDSECLGRTTGVLGSSNSYPATLELSEDNPMFGGVPFGQLSNNATANPPLYAYSKIFLPYGDGTSQVSDLAEPVSVGNSTVFYRGARVLRALIARLTSVELAGATEVVVGGSSAGGLSTYLARVVALSDSGFFLDYVAPDGKVDFRAQMDWVVRRTNGSGALPAACVAALPPSSNVSQCFFAEYAAATLTTPLFALNSEYDSFQVSSILGVEPSADAAINTYGALFTARLNASLRLSAPPGESPHGAFEDSCLHHTRGWTVYRDGELTQAAAFAQWLGQPAARSPLWLQQDKAYPCAACCQP